MGAVVVAVVIGLVGGASAGASRTTGVSSVTTPFGGTVIHVGNEWRLWMPSDHSTGTSGSVIVYANDGANTIAVGGSDLQASGTSFTVNYNSGSTINVCAPGAAFPFDGSHCDFNENLSFQKTFTSDADLGMIYIGGNPISGSFTEFSNSGQEITVPGPTSSLDVSAAPVDSNGETYKVNGTTGPQTVNLNARGVDTVVTVTGVANNGTTTQNYTFTVHRGLANANLTDLGVTPGGISFDGGTSYSTTVPSATTAVTVTPTLSDSNASYELKVGDTAYDNPVPLGDTDPTTIDVVVTADDATTQKTYSIAVSHLASIGLHAAFAGNGAGSVVSTAPDANLSCSSASPGADSCTASYDEGTTVDLQETPAAGSYFKGWSGACTGTNSQTEFTMPSSTATCTAEFDSLGAKQTGSTLKVTTAVDDGGADDLSCYAAKCTLRDALAKVPNGGTITFANSLTTVSLGEGLTFNGAGKTVTIDGGGDITVDGSSASGRSLDVTQGTVNLKNVTFGGNESNGGLAVETGAKLSLANVHVSGNGAEDGGGIDVEGTLTMTGGSLDDNGSFIGGGMLVAGTATLTNVDVASNFAFAAGGGIFVTDGGKVTLAGGTVAGNEADSGGGILVIGTLTANNTVISDNSSSSGAGVLVSDDPAGTATFSNATFVGNTGDWALTADGPAVAKLVNSTFVVNQGGVRGTGASFLNTLFAHNNGLDCDAPNEPTSLGHNVADDGTCWATDANGDQTVADAHVDEPTEDGYIQLGNGSAALDKGTKTGADGLTVPSKDARGIARPQGAGIDVGALEMQVHKLTVKTAGPGTGTVDPPTGSYVAGSTVELTATPTAPSEFAGWSGACSGTNPVYELELSGDKTCTATFAKPPAITSFSPGSSRIRSTVTIAGSGFTGTTGVTFNGHPATFKVVSDTKVTAVVPDDATSGPIVVTNPAGEMMSATDWQLVWAVPKIVSFTPAKAGGGRTVTITGSGFLGATSVDFNSHETDFSVVSDTKITALVPADATTGLLHVTTPSPTVAASKTSFTFIPLPVIDALVPDTAPVGATITINGSHLIGATVVSFNGKSAKPKTVTDSAVTVVVPDLATTGDLSITTPGGTTVSPGGFTQSFLTPVISSFTPAKGPIRSKVTITGSHFRGAIELSFGGRDAATWTIVSDKKITATVPDTALTGVIAVTNPATDGTGVSAKPFTVTWPVPKISSFAPLSGTPGATVTITGSGFLGATSVTFNDGADGASAVFTVVSATKITATVPGPAITGKIKVTTPGGTATSPKSFTVNSG